MSNQLTHPQKASARNLHPKSPQPVAPITDADLLAYLRQTQQIAPLLSAAEQDTCILQACEQLEIEVSEAELQAAGDSFRIQHRLTSVPQIIAWLAQQHITVEDWSEGIRHQLLTQKLQEFLFGESIDNYYLQNRKQYERVALSQIVVATPTLAEQFLQTLTEAPETFCAIALQYSILKNVHDNGGFTGSCFRAELQPEFRAAIANANPGEIVGPIPTTGGYHILKLEQCLPTQLTLQLRAQIMDTLLQSWLTER